MKAQLFSGVVLFAVGVACGVEVDIENKACPCGAGYVCDEPRNLCVRPDALAAANRPVCDPCPCEKDAECTDANRPICSPETKTCVECTPANDRCPATTYCNAKQRCSGGCRVSDDCLKIAPQTPLCAVERHQCVECLTAETCGGKSCSPSGACVETCSDAKPCAGGQGCCGGLCIDVTSDVFNCGKCGVVCEALNGTPSCTGSKCSYTCDRGYERCGGETAGCDTATGNDPTHCGSCTNDCTATMVHVLGLGCAAGSCTFVSCEAGWGNLDGNANNGCEAECGDRNEACCENNRCNVGLVCRTDENRCKNN